MTEKSKKIVKEEIEKLPKETQSAIATVDWVKISEEIGKKYLFSEDEINTLQLETASFLLGLVDEEDYSKNIEDSVGTSAEEAEKISNEIFEKIFMPINNILVENLKKNIQGKPTSWDQNLNFIQSGGDYSAFIEKKEEAIQEDKNKTIPPNTPPKIMDIKSKFTI